MEIRDCLETGADFVGPGFVLGAVLVYACGMEPTTFFTHAALGYVRVAVISPELRVADVAFNTARTVAAVAEAAAQGCQLAVFPELGLTSYSCADLFYHSVLLDAARAALLQVAEATAIHDIAAVVGLPLEVGGRLFNCAALLASGRLVGIVPKTFLPTTNEFYEARWFTSAAQGTPAMVVIDGMAFPFGADLIFPADNLPGCVLGLEVCEDLWAVNPPSGRLASPRPPRPSPNLKPPWSRSRPTTRRSFPTPV